MKSLWNFFTTINYKKILLIFSSPFVMMYENYKVMMIGLFVLVLIDMKYGVSKYCKKNNVKIKLLNPKTWGVITSAGARQTLKKLKDYIFLILAIWFFEHYMLKAPLSLFGYTLTGVVFLILGSVELWSIGENFKETRGYNIFDYIRKIVFSKDFKGVAEDISKKQNNGKT